MKFICKPEGGNTNMQFDDTTPPSVGTRKCTSKGLRVGTVDAAGQRCTPNAACAKFDEKWRPCQF